MSRKREKYSWKRRAGRWKTCGTAGTVREAAKRRNKLRKTRNAGRRAIAFSPDGGGERGAGVRECSGNLRNACTCSRTRGEMHATRIPRSAKGFRRRETDAVLIACRTGGSAAAAGASRFSRAFYIGIPGIFLGLSRAEILRRALILPLPDSADGIAAALLRELKSPESPRSIIAVIKSFAG